jgi:hypothetical protein
VVVCKPADPESKGLVERANGYLETSFLPGRLITEDSRWQLLSRCLRDPGIPLDVRTAGALLLLYGQFVSRLTRLTAADIDQHGPDASPHGLWAPALQRMQHFERARDWKPCPRRLSLDPVTGEATA